jgi:hypothetical protein
MRAQINVEKVMATIQSWPAFNAKMTKLTDRELLYAMSVEKASLTVRKDMVRRLAVRYCNICKRRMLKSLLA